MRAFLSGWLVLFLLGNVALGQTPANSSHAPDALPAPSVGPGCPGKEPMCTQCTVQCYMKKIPKTVYQCGSEPLCLPFLHLLGGDCGCGAGHCPQPLTRRFLLKKVETTEKPAVRNVAVQAPACAPVR